MTKLKNKSDALELALKLAIVAPDDKRMNEALSFAEKLASTMRPKQVEQIKAKIELELQ
jgi:hypothetical protein